jgi:hypothetical protein
MNALTHKLERLMRRHRQHAFDDRSGEAHTRALYRLKRTQTWATLMRSNEDAERQRQNARLDAMGY